MVLGADGPTSLEADAPAPTRTDAPLPRRHGQSHSLATLVRRALVLVTEGITGFAGSRSGPVDASPLVGLPGSTPIFVFFLHPDRRRSETKETLFHSSILNTASRSLIGTRFLTDGVGSDMCLCLSASVYVNSSEKKYHLVNSAFVFIKVPRSDLIIFLCRRHLQAQNWLDAIKIS